MGDIWTEFIEMEYVMDIFIQMAEPFWSAFTSSVEAMGHDIPAAQKFDSIFGRITYAMNRVHFPSSSTDAGAGSANKEANGSCSK